MNKNTTFEQAMSRLDEIVQALDGDKLALDKSLELFSEGAELIAFCNTRLNEAKLQVEELFPSGETGGGVSHG